MRQYNVIWADDDIFQLATDKDIADWRRDDQINIIARANTGTKLREAMKKHIGVVDAVIVDANFDANEIVVDNEKIISGLRRAFDLNRTYNEDERRGIPFFLYTGRTKDILYQACDSDDRKSLKEMCQNGSSVFFSTHVLEVAEKLCDKVAIIKKGNIIATGTMESVKGDKSLEDVFLELEDHE